MEGKDTGRRPTSSPTDADNLDLHAAQCERQNHPKNRDDLDNSQVRTRGRPGRHARRPGARSAAAHVNYL